MAHEFIDRTLELFNPVGGFFALGLRPKPPPGRYAAAFENVRPITDAAERCASASGKLAERDAPVQRTDGIAPDDRGSVGIDDESVALFAVRHIDPAVRKQFPPEFGPGNGDIDSFADRLTEIPDTPVPGAFDLVRPDPTLFLIFEENGTFPDVQLSRLRPEFFHSGLQRRKIGRIPGRSDKKNRRGSQNVPFHTFLLRRLVRMIAFEEGEANADIGMFESMMKIYRIA